MSFFHSILSHSNLINPHLFESHLLIYFDICGQYLVIGSCNGEVKNLIDKLNEIFTLKDLGIVCGLFFGNQS